MCPAFASVVCHARAMFPVYKLCIFGISCTFAVTSKKCTTLEHIFSLNSPNISYSIKTNDQIIAYPQETSSRFLTFLCGSPKNEILSRAKKGIYGICARFTAITTPIQREHSCKTRSEDRRRPKYPLDRPSEGSNTAQPAGDRPAGYLCMCYSLYFTIFPKSSFSDAPPTSPPSMSGCANSSGALDAETLPPYWIRMTSAVSSP